MPFLREEPIRYLVSRLHEQDAIVPHWDGDIEPLHALYAARLRPRIADATARGARALRDFLPEIDVEYVPQTAMERRRRCRGIVSQRQHAGGRRALRRAGERQSPPERASPLGRTPKEKQTGMSDDPIRAAYEEWTRGRDPVSARIALL